MAVVAPPPLQSKLEYWAAGSPTSRAVKATEQMTDIMSFQYPPPPNGTNIALQQSGYLPAEYSSVHSPTGLVQDSNMPPKGRHDPISKNLNMRLAKSLSTPASLKSAAVQQQVSLSQDQTALSLAAEKRRNKLGYHRTSVACGHCRRRKIRCIPSATDIQGRCANCIRLKKECSFYPVDQQPPTDTRKTSVSRPSVGLSPPSSQAPAAALVSNHNIGLIKSEDLERPPQISKLLTKHSIQTMAPPAMKAAGTEAYSPDSKMPSTSSAGRPFEYSSGMPNWMSAEVSPSSAKPGDLSAPWRTYTHDSPITPVFSSYPQHTAAPSATWAQQSEPAAREDMWPYTTPALRSLSFGTESVVGSHAQYPPIAQITSGLSTRPFDRKSGSMPEIYPPSVNTAGTALDHTVSLSAGAAGPQSYDGWQPYSYGKTNDPSDAYVGWGGEQATASATETHPTSSSVYYAGR